MIFRIVCVCVCVCVHLFVQATTSEVVGIETSIFWYGGMSSSLGQGDTGEMLILLPGHPFNLE